MINIYSRYMNKTWLTQLHFLTQVGDEVPTIFSHAVIDQTRRIITNGINDTAQSRKEVEWVTIDGIGSKDLDDAIWAERTSKWYRAYIHISDVAEAIPIYSPIDLEALRRTTSIYRRDNVIPMIPEWLSNDLLSLDGKRKNNTITLQIDLDSEWVPFDSDIYESRFTSHKRYDYDSFHSDASDPDSTYYGTLNLLSEITQKLHKNRAMQGWSLYPSIEDQPDITSHESSHTQKIKTHKNAHKIVEACMVLANHTLWTYMATNELLWIFRQHSALDEGAFYTPKSGPHRWLAINTGYTHGTSPIRRVADLVNHRILKAHKRWDKPPYEQKTVRTIVTHTNKTLLRIATLWQEMDIGKKTIDRYTNRLWDRLGTNDLWHFIRRASQDKGYRIPTLIRDTILEDINDHNSATWHWAVWIILLWDDITLKKALHHAVIVQKRISALSFLNILVHTRLIRWTPTIFSLHEASESDKFETQMHLPQSKVISYTVGIGKVSSMEEVRWRARGQLVQRIFKHYMWIK
jgi:RNB domain